MLIFVVLTLIIGYLIWNVISFRTSRIYKLGNKFNGPSPLPVLGNLLDFGLTNGDIFNALNNLHKKYGTTFRVYLGNKMIVVLSDPDDLEILMNNVKYIDKSEEYDFQKPWLGTGLLTSTGKKWKSHRKIITPTFHFKILEQFIDIFNTNADILVKNLKQEVGAGLFDIHSYATLYTLDVVCEAALGVNVNAQQNSKSEYVQAVKDITAIIFQRSFVPWLRNEFSFQFTPSARKHNKALKILHTKSRQVIKERKAQLVNSDDNNKPTEEEDLGVKKKLAFLDMLLQSSIEGNPLSDEDIREEVDTFMFEGHDTTASGISFTLAMLAAHPEVQEKVVKEIEDVLGDSNRQPGFRDFQEMKYLENVIKETLRLYPSVPLYARELQEDVTLSNGKVIPKGSTAGFLVFMTHRLEKHFPDPYKFDPERFDLVNSNNRHPYSYVPFSAGPRNCIGQKFAMLVMKSAVVKVMKNFHLKSASNSDFSLVNEMILKSAFGVNIEICGKKSE